MWVAEHSHENCMRENMVHDRISELRPNTANCVKLNRPWESGDGIFWARCWMWVGQLWDCMGYVVLTAVYAANLLVGDVSDVQSHYAQRGYRILYRVKYI